MNSQIFEMTLEYSSDDAALVIDESIPCAQSSYNNF